MGSGIYDIKISTYKNNKFDWSINYSRKKPNKVMIKLRKNL